MRTFFRRISAILLCLCLFMPIASAREAYPNASYTLSEVDFDISDLPVYIQSYMMDHFEYEYECEGSGEGLQPAGTVEELYGDRTFVPLYASENMDTLVCKGPVFIRDGKVILPVPNPKRSAPDPDGSLEFLTYSPALTSLNTSNGLIFSPDGRYAAFVDYIYVMYKSQCNFQLLLFDVEAGEYFMAQAWNTSYAKGNAAVVGAAFDPGSKYLYYITTGNLNEHRYSLYRYTLATGENILLCNHAEEVYYPNLTVISPSTLIAPMRTPVHNESGVSIVGRSGIMVYTKGLLSGWRCTVHELPVDNSCVVLERLDTSPKSGLALGTVYFPEYQYFTFPESMPESIPYSGMMLSLIDARKNCEGLDSVLLFNEDATMCEVVTYEDFMVSDLYYINTASDIRIPTVLNARLTPDGEHALAVFLRNDTKEIVWRLLNLKTLEIKKVEAPDAINSMSVGYNTSLSISYRSGISMLSDTLVAINTEDGVKLFELK